MLKHIMSKVSPQKGNIEPSQSAPLEKHFLQNLPLLRRYVAKLLPSRKNDVDDVVQEAFLRAYKASGDVEIELPRSYLFRVAKNIVLNQARHQNRWPTDYLDDIDTQTEPLFSSWELEDEILAQEKFGIHCAAVAALPEKCRKVYLLRKVYGKSHQEIAEALNISTSTVEKHLQKGFNRCRDYVEQRLATDASPVTQKNSHEER